MITIIMLQWNNGNESNLWYKKFELEIETHLCRS